MCVYVYVYMFVGLCIYIFLYIIQAYCISHLHLLFGCILSTLNKDTMMMMMMNGNRPVQWKMANSDPHTESQPLNQLQHSLAKLITSGRGPTKPNWRFLGKWRNTWSSARIRTIKKLTPGL